MEPAEINRPKEDSMVTEGTGQIHGGGVELGGTTTAAEAALIRQVSHNTGLKAVRKTILREPSGLAEMSHLSAMTEEDHTELLDHADLDNYPSLQRGGGGGMSRGMVVMILLALGVPAYMYMDAQAKKAEAERLARERSMMSGSFGVVSAMLIVGVLALVFLMRKCAGGSSAAEGSEDDTVDENKKWRRRSSMRQKGATPRLRRHNTDYD